MRRHGAWFVAGVLGLLLPEAGRADDEAAPNDIASELPRPMVATSPAGKPMNLLLTREELRSIVRNYEIRSGEDLTTPTDEDEVLVIGPRELAPMRDVSQDVWGGIAAPFWAFMKPKDAWRIFVPIPPKGRPKEEERATPDPR
jgi:hypothetical protein